MFDFPLIVLLPLVTFGLVIAFAMWSKKRTEDIRHDPDSGHSRLARNTTDPDFTPDRRVTNPQDVDR